MISKREQAAVEEFVSRVVREVWPAVGLSEEGMATAAWSLYATTMANLQIIILKHGDAEMAADHVKALLDHCAVITVIASCRSETEVCARMGMEAETVQARGTDGWKPAAEVKG